MFGLCQKSIPVSDTGQTQLLPENLVLWTILKNLYGVISRNVHLAGVISFRGTHDLKETYR